MGPIYRGTRYGLAAVLGLFAIAAACGGGGDSSSTTSSGGGTTVADTKSVSSIPALDLSKLSLADGRASNLAAPEKGLIGDQGKTNDFKAAFSRMGCEINQRLEEKQRLLDEFLSERCHMEVAEKAGFKVGTEEFVCNKITIPAPPKEFQDTLDSQRKLDQQQQGAGDAQFKEPDKDFKPEGNTMIVRAGNFGGNELRVDVAAQLPDGTIKRFSEVTVTVDDAAKKVSGTIVHSQPHGKGSDGARVDFTGTNVSVGSDGAITESDNALFSIIGQIDGLWGKMYVDYSHDKANALDKVRAYHDGNFTDPRRGVANKFTTSIKAVQNATCGCGDGSFTGSVPAIPINDFLKNVPEQFRSQMLQDIGAKEGLTLTTSSKVCPTPTGLKLASGNTCDVSNTFAECYTISAKAIDTALGQKLIDRKYAVVPDAQCADPSAANKKQTLLTTADAKVNVAFARVWDGTCAVYNTVDMAGAFAGGKITPSDFKKCMAYEERFRGRKGAGGEGCHEQEQRKAIEKEAKDQKVQVNTQGDSAGFNGQQQSNEFGGK